MTRNLQVSRDIAASPADVFAAISDVTRMGEWSTECHTCEWNDGATGPAAGVIFTGHNRNGDKEWTTEARIVACDPSERFVFDALSRGFNFATWGYEIEATEGGCRVTESWEDKRPQKSIDVSSKVSGVEDRAAFNEAAMATTLERIAAAVE